MALKKLLLACGAILLLSGMLLILSSPKRSVQETEKLETINYEVDSWEVSADLNTGDKIVVDFTPALWERHDQSDDIPYPYKIVRIEIVSPKNETTVFEITLTYPPQTVVARVSNITLVDRGGLSVTNPITKVGGDVMYQGRYTARIPAEYGLWPPEQDPPSWIALRKEIVERGYTFDFLLPVGVAFSVIGGVTFFGGIISRRRTSVRVKRKAKPK